MAAQPKAKKTTKKATKKTAKKTAVARLTAPQKRALALLRSGSIVNPKYARTYQCLVGHGLARYAKRSDAYSITAAGKRHVEVM